MPFVSSDVTIFYYGIYILFHILLNNSQCTISALLKVVIKVNRECHLDIDCGIVDLLSFDFSIKAESNYRKTEKKEYLKLEARNSGKLVKITP